MKRKLLLVLVASFIISSFAIANAFAWTADNYDQNSLSPFSTPHANTASVFQRDIGYTATPHTNEIVNNAYNRLSSDDVFFYAGHASGGILMSFTGNQITQKNSQFAIENLALSQMLLAVYSGCNTADRDSSFGCFLDGTNQGIKCVLAWNDPQYYPMAGTWMDRYWDCMRYWGVSSSAQNANTWTWVCHQDMGYMNCWTTSGNANQVIYH